MLPHFGQGTEEDKALDFIASIDELSIANVLDASSSSVIVKVAVSSEKVELVALERVMVAVSLVSSVESARMGTLKVPEVSPAEIVREPEVEV